MTVGSRRLLVAPGRRIGLVESAPQSRRSLFFEMRIVQSKLSRSRASATNDQRPCFLLSRCFLLRNFYFDKAAVNNGLGMGKVEHRNP
jgi:hypothetical protein